MLWADRDWPGWGQRKGKRLSLPGGTREGGMGEDGLGGGCGLWGPRFQPLVPRNLGSGVSLCSEAHLSLICHPPFLAEAPLSG